MKKTNIKTKTSSSKPKLIPTRDRVLLRPLKEDGEKMIGKIKIILPDGASGEKSDQAVVLAVGEGKYEDGKLVPMRVKVGDTVIYSKYSYDEVKLMEEELYLVKEENILAIIK